MGKRIEWINLARGMGMFLVVLGHAMHDSFVRIGGGYPIASWLIDFIYSFHMPLFFFIAGFCAERIVRMNSFSERIAYIKSRFIRLMIPYFFVGILYVPLKLVMAEEVTKQVDLGTLLYEFMTGTNPNFQLWTLYALFVITIITCVAAQINKRVLLPMAIALCFVSLFFDTGFQIVNKSFYECIYFVCGIYARSFWSIHGDDISKNRRKTCYVLMVALSLLIAVNIIKEISAINQLKILTAFFGILFVCSVAVLIENKKPMVLDALGYYGMDIYIMANLVQVFCRSVFLNRLGLPNIMCCVISTLFGILCPIIASKLVVRRFRVTRFLILGQVN